MLYSADKKIQNNSKLFKFKIIIILGHKNRSIFIILDIFKSEISFKYVSTLKRDFIAF